MNSPACDSRWRRASRGVLHASRLAWRKGVDFLLPPSCLACGVETSASTVQTDAFCPDCRSALSPAPAPECLRCGAPVGPYLDTIHGCIHCRNDKFHFDGVIRLGVYKDELRRAVLQAKSATGDALTRRLGDLLLAAKSGEFLRSNWDAVVAVPHHWTQRFRPQHAASETLAEHLAAKLQLPLHRQLARKIKRTPQQAGSPPSVRRRQQRGAFAAESASGLRILLVDDVLTTGATANEVAKALKSAGAAGVRVAVIARGLGEKA